MLEGIQKMIDEAIEVLYIKYVTGTLHENDKEFVERELVQTGVFKARLIADGKKAKAEGLY